MKRIIAVMVFVAFATVAFANPFTDVPFTHWAYDAVAKLSARGIVTGFPDGTFKGNRTMTRYELAMVVARLMARFEDTRGHGMTRGDYATLERLTVEFADELALLGVKVMALEDEVAMVRDDVAALKRQARYTGHCGSGKVSITGDFRTEYRHFNFDDADNVDGYRQRMALFLDTPIDEDVSYHMGLLYTGGFNNWGSGLGANDNYAGGFEVQHAYVQINDFFGWADVMKIGRQRMSQAHDLLFLPVELDGIYAARSFDNKFDLSAYGVASPDTTDLGLNIWGVIGEWDLADLHLQVYYTAKNDHNDIHNPGGRGIVAGGAIAGDEYLLDGQFEGNTYTAGYVANWEDITATNYMGLAIHGDLYKDLSYYAEIARLNWVQDALNPDFTDGGTTLDPQHGFVAGIEWLAWQSGENSWTLSAEYRRHGQYFEPLTAGRGKFENNLKVQRPFGAEFPALWNELRYTRDFSDLYVKADYQFNPQAAGFIGYELIRDGRPTAATEISDDMVITSIGFRYWYKSNTFFQIAYYQFGIEETDAGESFVGATDKGLLTEIDNLHIGNLSGVGVEEKQNMIRMEMQVRF